MTSCSFSMPWGAVWKYECSAVPRLGEHVSMGASNKVYVVTEVRHFPFTNSAWINLKDADGV